MDYTKNFDMAMSNRQHGISVYTGTTSEYGLNPSSSSSDNGRWTDQDKGRANKFEEVLITNTQAFLIIY